MTWAGRTRRSDANRFHCSTFPKLSRLSYGVGLTGLPGTGCFTGPAFGGEPISMACAMHSTDVNMFVSGLVEAANRDEAAGTGKRNSDFKTRDGEARPFFYALSTSSQTLASSLSSLLISNLLSTDLLPASPVSAHEAASLRYSIGDREQACLFFSPHPPTRPFSGILSD